MKRRPLRWAAWCPVQRWFMSASIYQVINTAVISELADETMQQRFKTLKVVLFLGRWRISIGYYVLTISIAGEIAIKPPACDDRACSMRNIVIDCAIIAARQAVLSDSAQLVDSGGAAMQYFAVARIHRLHCIRAKALCILCLALLSSNSTTMETVTRLLATWFIWLCHAVVGCRG